MSLTNDLGRVQRLQLARMAAQVEEPLGFANSAVTWIKLNAAKVADRANSDLDDAPRGINYEPRARGGGEPGNPTLQKAAADRADDVAQTVAALEAHLLAARKAARTARVEAEKAERAALSLIAIDPEQARQLTGADQLQADQSDTRKSYVCANISCKATVSNTPNDRLRSGRCPSCYRYRLRHDGTDRPRELCDQGPDPDLEPALTPTVSLHTPARLAHPVFDRRCGHPVWTSEGEQPCVLERGTEHVCSVSHPSDTVSP